MLWSNAERAKIVELYLQSASIVQAQRDFKSYFKVKRSPSAREIRNYVKKFRETASAQPSTSSGRRRSVRTPENIEAVRDAVLKSPTRSTRKLSQALDIKRTSLMRILKGDLKLYPYKIQVCQKLKQEDKAKRIEFCDKFLRLIQEDETFIEKLIMSDEAHFHLIGYVNKQNTRFWAEKHPEMLHEAPLHSERLTVWCGVTWYGIIGPYFFSDENGVTVTVTSVRYRKMMEEFVAPILKELGLDQNAWFQQDGVTCHTAKASMALLREMFPQHIISRFGDIPWPPRSPDLTAPDFFLW